ncbi:MULTISPECIES: UDP-glucose 4-epimerase GalE [unclassified Methylophaga]|jgi:UDP-glucose 4-epimerase|uniref:UDP-glucose 4-epimerase GalE n=3 Tax=Methylophaga TaxID=40222 RepID=UPI000C97C1D3|nr:MULTISPECIES: UDP-glucose 4-epimerase GalE [unclassified Methylophaga]MAK67289.1 UDP-glucose 4-epimerase GalE [Methylophaga sp.]MAY18326.1 UDP-glucose 4-epimerase GalE [Methylophaga sp.]|tara:strand:+ start:37703 stop:38683 length:981 start_codon:yes stop_codon:yes gene_type:complete
MKVLVLGGAGYIGSHICKALALINHQSVVVDNLSTGHREAVRWSQFIEADILDADSLIRILQDEGPFDLIMHFCAKSLVGESMQNPALYYRNNVVGTLNLLDAMVATGHDKLVFSSTAAVFGMPERELINEEHSRLPINPYGQSKKMIEDILGDYHHAFGIKSVALRYFNACGADADGEIGERHEPETHLIPNILKSVIAGKTSELKVFGDNYLTPDGTCIRDYIHVSDLASAHILAGEYLQKHAGAFAFNLGNGNGFSVLDVIKAARKVVGQNIVYTIEGPRAGDPPVLVADAKQAEQVLGWQPAYTDIESIIATAWHWHQNETF